MLGKKLVGNVTLKNGFPEKLGGWQKESFHYSVDPSTSVAVQGKPKKAIYWRGFDSIDRIAVGTTSHLYLIKENVLHDITSDAGPYLLVKKKKTSWTKFARNGSP